MGGFERNVRSTPSHPFTQHHLDGEVMAIPNSSKEELADAYAIAPSGAGACDRSELLQGTDGSTLNTP